MFAPEAHQWVPVLPPALMALKSNPFRISAIDIIGSRLQTDF